MTTIQALALTLDIEGKRLVVLDALRRKRNLASYTGEDIDDESVTACMEQAEELLQMARERISKMTLT